MEPSHELQSNCQWLYFFYGDLTAASDFLKDLPRAAANIVKIQLGKLGFAHLKKLNGSTNDPGDCNIPSPIMEIEVDA